MKLHMSKSHIMLVLSTGGEQDRSRAGDEDDG